ncbi:MAG: GNAT family N-acetyltransferase [Sphingomonadales bacterium]
MADLKNISIRRARDNDAAGLIDLIGTIFKDYENCILDLADLDKELLTIDTAMRAQGGKFWMATFENRIVGSIGYGLKGDFVELKRLYVAKDCRGTGLASKLAGLVYNAAGNVGAGAIELWSDTRFIEAHAFYLKHGFEKQPETRDLHDLSNSSEYHFIKKLM